MKIAAIILFLLMYFLMTVFLKRRIWIVLSVAAIFVITGILPISMIFSSIDWNVIMMIGGTMVLVDFFIASKMPNLIADCLLFRAGNVMWVIILMSLFSGFISAFIDNVATVLMVAPVGIAVCRKMKISSVPMVISIAVSSNLQGAATMVGDATSIMLGAYAKMDFSSFFWMDRRPGIFFSVELGALSTVPIMMLLFRSYRQKVSVHERTIVEDLFPSFLLIIMIALLICVSFIQNKPAVTNGLICAFLALVAAAHDIRVTGKSDGIVRSLKNIDFETLVLLTGLFLVIKGVREQGVITDIANGIARFSKDNVFILYTVVVWGSVVFSAFIDNIPYVATMLPVIEGISSSIGVKPYLLYFALMTGATLGGNLTPIGASANITAIGLLKKEGLKVTFKDFAVIGIPFTLAAVTAGYLFTWFVWS